MKKFKRIMALVIALAMVVAMALPSFAADAGTYTITVTNSNESVSIDGETYSAYKVFDVTYQNPQDDPNTPQGNDTAPHAYYLSTTSKFYTGATYADGAWTFTDNSPAKVISEYFDFTYLEADSTKVSVTPKVDGSGKSTFTEAKAYEMAQKLANLTPAFGGATASNSAAAASGVATIDVSADGPGYYLVTGTGHPFKEDGSVDKTQTVTAAVALTTTDPKAAIIAKVDGVTVEKRIDEGVAEAVEDNPETTEVDEGKDAVTSGNGALDEEDLKEDNHAVGDKVPYVIKSKVPNMTGYEKYFFIVTDTLSKGLKFDNNVVIKIGDKTLSQGTDYTLTTTGGAAGEETAIEIVFKNFIQYKGDLVTDETYESLGLEAASIGTYYGDYTGADILITYSATVDSDAVIGDAGNPNTISIEYSNNPDKQNDGTPEQPDKPNPEGPDVTGETPDSTTKTYVTGLKALKFTTGADDAKNPLADATFELTGENLNKLVETDKKYFRKITTGETGTHYLLKDGTYTTTEPQNDDPNTELVNEDTTALYVSTTKDYIQDEVKSFALAGTSPNVKVTVTTDAEGLMTFTGLAAGDYVLTETEAPAGYNKLKDKIYITVGVGTTESDENLDTHTWTITYKMGEDGEEKTLTSSAASANLFELEIENQTGTELPSTGGIGTTIFYVVGAILVIGAGVVLITRRRMDA